MTLSTSNTFTLPSQGAAVATSRTQFNSSLRSLLQNFYSPAPPTSVNLVDSDSALPAADYNGLLYRDSNTGVFYVSDSSVTVASGRTSRPIGGNFTRYGIAWQQQGSLVAAAANISKFDIGEAFVVVQNSAGANNNRMYLKTTASTFVDVGKPAPGQVTETELAQAVKNKLLLPTHAATSTTTAGTNVQYTLGSDAANSARIQVFVSGVEQRQSLDWTLNTSSSPYKITLLGTYPAGLRLSIKSWAI